MSLLKIHRADLFILGPYGAFHCSQIYVRVLERTKSKAKNVEFKTILDRVSSHCSYIGYIQNCDSILNIHWQFNFILPENCALHFLKSTPWRIDFFLFNQEFFGCLKFSEISIRMRMMAKSRFQFGGNVREGFILNFFFYLSKGKWKCAALFLLNDDVWPICCTIFWRYTFLSVIVPL